MAQHQRQYPEGLLISLRQDKGGPPTLPNTVLPRSRLGLDSANYTNSPISLWLSVVLLLDALVLWSLYAYQTTPINFYSPHALRFCCIGPKTLLAYMEATIELSA